MFSLRLTLTILVATTAHALVLDPSSAVGRRSFLGGVLGSAAVIAGASDVQAKTLKPGIASPFTGDYDDPQHPNCLRQVKVVGAPLKADGTRSAYPPVEVVGWDGKDGEKTCTDRPTREELWKVDGKLKTEFEATIDFSPKGGPKNMAVSFTDGGIVFPDGNKWTKVIEGTNQRRPKDMSTLKSKDE